MRDKIDSILNEAPNYNIKNNDIVIEYKIRIVTKDGVLSDNQGTSRLNSIINPRLLAEAPRRFESEFQHLVFEPVYADAMEFFDAASSLNNGRTLDMIKQPIGGYDTDGIPGLLLPLLH